MEKDKKYEIYENSLPGLGSCVMRALEFLDSNPPPELDLSAPKNPIVVGSGNAFQTGKILFDDRKAYFATESSYEKEFRKFQDQIGSAVVISASGSKDSVRLAQFFKGNGKRTYLITCTENSEASKEVDEVMAVFRKIPEPYTYNNCTYLGMIISKTGEKPSAIAIHITAEIEQMEPEISSQAKSHDAYMIVVPDMLEHICPMSNTKFDELYGGRVAGRTFTEGGARHAKNLVVWERELVAGLGADVSLYGLDGDRLNIPLPEEADYASAMAVCYYFHGKIQESKPQWFKQNVDDYCLRRGPKAYGRDKPFPVVVR